jgi:GNAT superfamily N-acetyltransferase
MNPVPEGEAVENGYGPNSVPGDTLFNDFIGSEAVSAEVLARARGERTYRDRGRLTMVDGASPLPFSNVAVIERPPRAEEVESFVAEIRAFYADHPGGPCLLKSLFPLPDLAPLGCVLMGHPPLMLRTPIPLPAQPADLEIVRVADERTSSDYEETLVLGYPAPMLQPFRAGCFLPPGSLDAPGWHHFVGYAERSAVAAGSAYVDDNVLRVENIAVMGDARGRGFGAAITAATITVDLDVAALLIASDLGRPIYERLGFRALHRATYWLVPR